MRLKGVVDYADKKRLAALCHALGLPSSYYVEIAEIGVIEIKIRNGQSTKNDGEASIQ